MYRASTIKSLTFLTGFCLWEISCLLAQTNSFPHSWTVVLDLGALVATWHFWSSVAVTLWLSSCGLVLGSVIALVIGLAIGLSPAAEKSTSGVLNFFRSVPSVVFLPLLVASVGSSVQTVITLTAMIVSLKLVIYVIRGVRDTDLQLIESADALGLRQILKIFYIYLPSAVSIVGTGLRLSASRAFGTVVAAGIVAGTPGIGLELSLAESRADYSRAFSYICVMGLVGTLIYTSLSAFERKYFVWRVAK